MYTHIRTYIQLHNVRDDRFRQHPLIFPFLSRFFVFLRNEMQHLRSADKRTFGRRNQNFVGLSFKKFRRPFMADEKKFRRPQLENGRRKLQKALENYNRRPFSKNGRRFFLKGLRKIISTAKRGKAVEIKYRRALFLEFRRQKPFFWQ